MTQKSKLIPTFALANSPFADGLPSLQPAVSEWLYGDEKMSAYRADAKLAMPILKDCAIFLMQEARKDFFAISQDFERRALPTDRYIPGPMKLENRIRDKASREKVGPNNEPRFDDIRDYGRGKIDLDTPEEIAAISGVLDWALYAEVELPHGAFLIDLENRFKNPTPSGYRSLKANIVIPLPPGASRPYHIVELQVQHAGFERDIKAAKDNKFGFSSHRAYDGKREMEERFKTDPRFWTTDPVTGTTALTPAISKHYGAIIRACTDKHNKYSEIHGLKNINFKPYEDRRFEMAMTALNAIAPKDLTFE